MIETVINLSNSAYVKTYIIERSSYIQNGFENTWQPKLRPAVIVLPGGGYNYIADSENEPVIYHFLTKGYSCFSLYYSIAEKSKYPNPLIEVFETIKYIRNKSIDWGIDPNAIAICGFSAGAHLAGLCATQYSDYCFINEIGFIAEEIKPNAVILCYPITNISKLKKEDPKRVATWGEMLNSSNNKINVVDFVSDKMSPVFLWHTRTDGIVPVTQSLELINKMQENNVKYECHIFGEGYHGLSTNDVLSNYKGAIQNGIIVPNVEKWVDMCSNWLNRIFSFDC